MKHRALLLPTVLTVALASACTSQSSDASHAATTSAATQPSIAVSVPPAPPQASQKRDTVDHDPCLKLGDDVVESIGFDPATRERDDYIFDTYSAIGCKFRHEEQDQFDLTVTTRNLSVNTSNLTLDEFRSREGDKATPTTVNERDAITYTDPAAEACYVIITSKSGTLSVRKSTAIVFSPEKPCDHIQEIAAKIESSMPE